MYLSQYKIADLVLNVNCDDPVIIRLMNGFLLNQPRMPDLNISLKTENFINVPEGRVISDENIKWLYKLTGENGYYIYNTERNHGKVLTLAEIDYEWRNGKFLYFDYSNQGNRDGYQAQTEYYTHVLMGMMFRNCLINHGGIVIHASTLECEGRGIMFSAPSGTGKSTHVKLWQEYIGDGVRILNDDTPAVRSKDGKLHVFGTPWCGSSGIYCNASAPLEAIVLLEQAQANSLQQLSVPEAMLKLMPRAFLPYFDQEMMHKTFDIMETIYSLVPVYLLKCRPDKEAVELVYQCVMS